MARYHFKETSTIGRAVIIEPAVMNSHTVPTRASSKWSLIRGMAAGNLAHPYFFTWNRLAYGALFITSIGWSFYLIQIVFLYIGEQFFDLEYYFTSRLGHVDFILIHVTITCLIAYGLSKRNAFAKNKFLVLIGISVTFNLVLRLVVLNPLA